jgi:4-hydroxybenzoate polyprenyltransferase
VTLALPGHPWPPAWAVAAGALLGVGAHLVNVLPDLADDAATGVRGLPHRLGGRAAGLLAPVVLLAASAAVVVGPTGPPTPAGWVGLALAGVLGSVAAWSGVNRPGRRLPLLATALVALVDVVLLLGSGASLS